MTTTASLSGTSRSLRSLPVSAKVGVLYDPNNPQSAIINRSLEKFGIYFAVLFAVAFIVIGILILVGVVHPSMMPDG